MQDDYTNLKGQWLAGDRSRELGLQLMFLAWMHWADPPFVTGLSDDPEAASLWREAFAYLGGEASVDAEFLYVSGVMAELFPWMLGDEDVWRQQGSRLLAKAKELEPAGVSAAAFEGRGLYGDYFAQRVRRASRP